MKKKITIEIVVNDCRDCYFTYRHRGHGEAWEECSHPDSDEWPGNIINGYDEDCESIPIWCPLGLAKNKITSDHEKVQEIIKKDVKKL